MKKERAEQFFIKICSITVNDHLSTVLELLYGYRQSACNRSSTGMQTCLKWGNSEVYNIYVGCILN